MFTWKGDGDNMICKQCKEEKTEFHPRHKECKDCSSANRQYNRLIKKEVLTDKQEQELRSIMLWHKKIDYTPTLLPKPNIITPQSEDIPPPNEVQPNLDIPDDLREYYEYVVSLKYVADKEYYAWKEKLEKKYFPVIGRRRDPKKNTFETLYDKTHDDWWWVIGDTDVIRVLNVGKEVEDRILPTDEQVQVPLSRRV